jgi:hypothetical protein
MLEDRLLTSSAYYILLALGYRDGFKIRIVACLVPIHPIYIRFDLPFFQIIVGRDPAAQVAYIAPLSARSALHPA